MRSDWRSARRPTVVEVTKNVRVDWGAWAFSPGLKPGRCKVNRFRGFENPLPRTESPGLAQLGTDHTVACHKLWCLGSAACHPGFENVETPGPARNAGCTLPARQVP